ncbi:uncharacterized protein PV07_12542 [Cladophialophora immunda]|uniref:Uncharacterized protein n=1 Tax=Cladophialophora immunda TaxID=569365 RepID=A0A0D2CEV2_9EURO|nr:uncharacterized protein PV07_12542 [Cladophialophora immunda]KIW22059.1 hypothetical protein PV07_12542 [Cladophialophora immunda]
MADSWSRGSSGIIISIVVSTLMIPTFVWANGIPNVFPIETTVQLWNKSTVQRWNHSTFSGLIYPSAIVSLGNSDHKRRSLTASPVKMKDAIGWVSWQPPLPHNTIPALTGPNKSPLPPLLTFMSTISASESPTTTVLGMGNVTTTTDDDECARNRMALDCSTMSRSSPQPDWFSLTTSWTNVSRLGTVTSISSASALDTPEETTSWSPSPSTVSILKSVMNSSLTYETVSASDGPNVATTSFTSSTATTSSFIFASSPGAPGISPGSPLTGGEALVTRAQYLLKVLGALNILFWAM